MANIVEKASQTNVTPAIASAATALSANTSRRWFQIQNSGMNALFVRLGSGASTTVWDFVLKAGTANDDGTAGSFASGVVCYQGIITIAGTSPRYVASEI